MSEPLTAAVRQFNEGNYLPAHELLEELWEANEGGDADFFKGLIQATICLHHLQEDNAEGAKRLYAGHRRYLGRFLPTHRGLDVAGFLESMQAHLRPVLRGEASAAEPRPRLEILADEA